MSLTPMLKQYQTIRNSLDPDTVLFFRMGDFYEMFMEDARRAAPILDITLTARDGGSLGRIPMCGVPYHAAQGYINRLTRSGLKVAVCEQMEDPRQCRGLVAREVVRIVSPGTNLEDDQQEAAQGNWLAAWVVLKQHWGLACLDLSTGEFRVGQYASVDALEDELCRLAPRECILPRTVNRRQCDAFLCEYRPAVTEYDDWVFEPDDAARRVREHYQVASLASFGLDQLPAGVCGAGALLYYLTDTLHTSLGHLRPPLAMTDGSWMRLDRQTIRNLELVPAGSRDRQTPTLYDVVNRTVTPLGARLLGAWLLRPLVRAESVNERLAAVADLVADAAACRALQEQLRAVRDLERLVARINCGTPSARDMVALGSSLAAVPGLRENLAGLSAPLLAQCRQELHPLPELTAELARAFVDQPPAGIRDGGFIRAGYSPELDQLRRVATDARQWLADLQQREAEATGIKSLKIKFNKVFGYYIEVTRPNLPQVPDCYIRKQTLVNAERFIIPELKEYEEKILGAEDRGRDLEVQLFAALREQVLAAIEPLQQTARALARIDVLAGFAATAREGRYCRPEVTDSAKIDIVGGRHPVVEQTLNGDSFVANDLQLDTEENQLLIITGPNMAGKSTYIRQAALITLLAQVGCFVPARVARIGVVDRIFSRIGASDNLARGESTFMVEMIETANIVHNATPRSLLVFDEIGRGTSTFDGLSIAWSVCEHLTRDGFRPKCLFATHYHELTELAGQRPGVQNLNVTVREVEDSILFLRTVVAGGADRSYGIHVAKLAGLPATIIARAREILLCLEEEKISEESIAQILRRKHAGDTVYDLPLFRQHRPPDEPERAGASTTHPVVERLAQLDPDRMTPLEALTTLSQLQQLLRQTEGG